MVMVDPNGILLCENRKAAGGCWLMALIRHIEEACDISRKLAMSASKAKRTNYGKSVSHTKLAVVAQRSIDAAVAGAPDDQRASDEPAAATACSILNGATKMDYRKKFAIEPGAKVQLAKIDDSYTRKHDTHEKALPDIQANGCPASSAACS